MDPSVGSNGCFAYGFVSVVPYISERDFPGIDFLSLI